MKKYLIIDTYNGEGYSDSKVEVKEFSNRMDAQAYAFKLAQEFCSKNGSVTALEDRIEYGLNYDEDEEQYEDQGTVHFRELEDWMYSITTNPTINDYAIHEQSDDADIRAWLHTSEESQDGEDLEGTCHHMDDSVEIYFLISNL